MAKYEVKEKKGGRGSGSFDVYRGKLFVCLCLTKYQAEKIRDLLNG